MSDVEKAPLPLPEQLTEAGTQYYAALDKDMRFAGFIANTVITIDHQLFELEQVLEGKQVKQGPAELAKENPGARTKVFRSTHTQTFVEMLLVRFVDSFQKYLSDLIREVLRKQPAVLSSSHKSLSLEEVLKFDRMDDLLSDIIDRKVSDLSYQGFKVVREWCAARGIPIAVSENDLPKVVDYLATRNIIAHNRGRIDKRYLNTVPTQKLAEGDTRPLGHPELWDAIVTLTQVVIRTDAAVGAKFGLSVKPFEASAEASGAAPPSETVI